MKVSSKLSTSGIYGHDSQICEILYMYIYTFIELVFIHLAYVRIHCIYSQTLGGSNYYAIEVVMWIRIDCVRFRIHKI